MRFSDLQRKDVLHAFSDFITVAQAKEEGVIPPPYHPYFKDECTHELCKSDMIITRTATRIMCCNPRCPIKVAYSLDKLLDNFNCKNIGIATCTNIVNYAYQYMDRKSHLEVLTMEDRYLTSDLRGMSFYHFKTSVTNIRDTVLSYPDMIARLAIPSFGGNSNSIFSGVSGTQQLVEEIKAKGSIQGFLNYRGVKDTMRAFYLSEFLHDIAYAEAKVFRRVRAQGLQRIPICMTGNFSIGGYKTTKDRLVKLFNEICVFNGVQVFEFELTEAIKSVDYVLADNPSTSMKYRIAQLRQAEERRRIIYTAQEFIDYLKEVMECLRENKPLPSRNL